MRVVDRVARAFGYEKRSVNLKDPYFAEMMGARASAAGVSVTPENATGLAAVHACVQLISETVASLPLTPYRRMGDGGKEVDTNHPLYNVLHNQSNRVQTAFEFREQFVASCLLSGNGYARKIIDGRGAVSELIPLQPGDVTPHKLINGRIRYDVRESSGKMERYTQDEILHLRYRSEDGIIGKSPITINREAIGLALAQQEYEAGFYKNGGRPSAIFKMERVMNDTQREQFRKNIADYRSAANAGKIPILEGGVTWENMSLSMVDAQFVESQKLTLDNIARIFRVPPPAIGILTDATYSNITEQQRSLVMHTIRPWLVRIEQAMNSALLTREGRRTHLIEHNAEGLLRGNQKERFEAYQIGREFGWLNVNEIRQKENLGGIGTKGDAYLEPNNTRSAEQ